MSLQLSVDVILSSIQSNGSNWTFRPSDVEPKTLPFQDQDCLICLLFFKRCNNSTLSRVRSSNMTVPEPFSCLRLWITSFLTWRFENLTKTMSVLGMPFLSSRGCRDFTGWATSISPFLMSTLRFCLRNLVTATGTGSSAILNPDILMLCLREYCSLLLAQSVDLIILLCNSAMVAFCCWIVADNEVTSLVKFMF